MGLTGRAKDAAPGPVGVTRACVLPIGIMAAVDSTEGLVQELGLRTDEHTSQRRTLVMASSPRTIKIIEYYINFNCLSFVIDSPLSLFFPANYSIPEVTDVCETQLFDDCITKPCGPVSSPTIQQHRGLFCTH